MLRALDIAQRKTLRRLLRVGCPMDARLLQQGLAVRLVASELPGHVFPLEDGTGLVLWLRMVASAPLTICSFRLRASWISEPFELLAPCPKHPTHVCLPDKESCRLRFRRGGVLNQCGYPGRTLRSGRVLRGFLVAKSRSLMPENLNGELAVTLSVEDACGDERDYRLVLECNW